MHVGFLNRRIWLAFLASVITGAGLIFAFPRFDQGEIAWLALVPLAIVAVRTTPRAAAAWSYLSGAIYFVGSLYWLVYVTAAGWIVLGLFLGLYFAAWGWFVAYVSTRFDTFSVVTKVGNNLLVAFLAACGWVGAEIIRTHLFTGFPWNLLGVSQYRSLPVIQMASVTGVYGVSWLICFVNLCLAMTALRLREEFSAGRSRSYKPHFELTLALLLVVVAMITGLHSVHEQASISRSGQKLDVAVIQPNIPQEEKWDEKFNEMIYARLEQLTDAAIHTHPDLIVWPETATPEPLLYDANAFRIITNAVKRSGASLLTGSMEIARGVPRSQSDPSSADRVWYNSAYVVTPKGRLEGPYNKQHLVPFGEFVPLAKLLPFMKYTTPIPGSFGRGRQQTIFGIPNMKGEVSKVGCVICFEDVFPNLFRQFVCRGAQLMVNVTNDAWYKESAGAYQHMANSVFRAVENRVSFVRCANSGYSCFIDPAGAIVGSVTGEDGKTIFVRGWKTGRVSVREPSEASTFYARHGDVFAWSCFGIAMLAILYTLRVPKRAPRISAEERRQAQP